MKIREKQIFNLKLSTNINLVSMNNIMQTIEIIDKHFICFRYHHFDDCYIGMTLRYMKKKKVISIKY